MLGGSQLRCTATACTDGVPTWDTGVALGSHWGHTGITLGSHWGRTGITLGSHWGILGSALVLCLVTQHCLHPIGETISVIIFS